MFDVRLSPEQQEMQETVRDFVARELKPLALDPARLQDFSPPLLWDVLEKASNMGLKACALSEERGGAGADTLTLCVVMEELAAGDVGVASIIGTTAVLAHAFGDVLMNASQRERFLQPFLARPRYHLAFASADRDTAAGWNYQQPAEPSPVPVSAIARGDGDWVLNGTTRMTSNAAIADTIAVQVRAAGDNSNRTSIVLVPRETPGLSVVPEHSTTEADGPPSLLAWHHGASARLSFDDCRVAAAQLLGKEGEGVGIASSPSLKRAVVVSAAINLGLGRAAYEAALDYTKIRRQGGRNIVEHEAIGMFLADMAIRLEAARNIIWKAAWAADHPDQRADAREPNLPLATMAKVLTSETVHEVALEAAECFGAMGVMRDMPLQKYVHDALVFVHGEVSNTAARLRIAEAVSGYERPALQR